MRLVLTQWRPHLTQLAEEKADKRRFELEIARRGITRLVHFTPAINLLSICEQGEILSRERLQALSVSHPELHVEDYLEVNDKLRLDKRPDYICTSVEHPNHWLFKRFRDSCRAWCDSWCVIILPPSLIWLRKTLFSIGNAASRLAQDHGIDGSFSKFLALFQSQVTAGNSSSQRILNRNGLADCHPTDVQAEVLVRSQIPLGQIKEVCFATEDELRRMEGAVSVLQCAPTPPFVVNNAVFCERGA